MMIYDAFIFFNELELLEIRLHELNSVVDRFVLVEASRTHTNSPKPLHFKENRDAFRPFLDKIIHVEVNDTPNTQNAGVVEDFQRDCIARGLQSCKPDDIVMLSDVDEIPRAEKVREAAQSFRFRTGPVAQAWHGLLKHPAFVWTFRNWFKRRHPFVKVFIQSGHKFFLNCVRDGAPSWKGTRMVQYRDLGRGAQLRRWSGEPVDNGGWHFSSMGGVERVQLKIASFCHREFNKPEFTDTQKLADAIQRGIDLNVPDRKNRFEPINDSYPRYVREHPERFKTMIRELG